MRHRLRSLARDAAACAAAARRAPHRTLAFSSVASQTSTTTHYERLGVPPSCDVDALRRAYLAAARRLHPDATPQQGHGGDAAGDAGAEFRLVAAAYEVLRCPGARALYDAQLAADAAPLRAAAAAAAASGARRRGAARAAPPWRGADAADSALAAHPRLREQLDDALAAAYWGPAGVDLSAAAAGVLPRCFECEERAPSAAHHADLLQLVSGRTLLGVVRDVRAPRLAPGGTSLAAGGDAARGDEALAAGVARAPLPRPAAAPGGGAAQQEDTELVDELQLLCGGSIVAQAQRRPRRASPSASSSSSQTRQRRPWLGEDGAGSGDITVFLRGALHCRVSSGGGGYDVGVVHDARGQETHTLLLHSTPWVAHLHAFCSDSGRCACRAQRAWLPPSALWLFQPRLQSHDVGGWTIESPFRAPPAASQSQSLPPPGHELRVVMALVAAFHTLDRERGRHGGMLGGLARMLQRAWPLRARGDT
jgi:hypothetical protein